VERAEAREIAEGEMMKSKGMWRKLIKRSRQRPNFRKAQPSTFVESSSEKWSMKQHTTGLPEIFKDDQKAQDDFWSPRWMKPEDKEKVKAKR